MRMPIQRICTNCKHVDYFSIGGIIWNLTKLTLMILGVCFLAYLYLIGPVMTANNIVGGSFTHYAKRNQEELRMLALNYTTYDGGDTFDFAYDLVENMPHIRYVLPSMFEVICEPIQTLKYGGDCKSSSVLFTGMMLAVGHSAYVDCDHENKHCVTIVPFKENGTSMYMVVDLTVDAILVYDKGVDHWRFPYMFQRGYTFRSENGEVK